MTQALMKLATSARLVVLLKGAYWAGLLLIAAITMVSFLLLREMLVEQQVDATAADINSRQIALSQRIVALSKAVEESPGEWRQQLTDELRETTDTFARNQDALAQLVRHHAASAETGSLSDVFYAAPYDLDVHAQFLIAGAQQTITAMQPDATAAKAKKGSSAKTSPKTAPALDQKVAEASLFAFTELGSRIDAAVSQRLGSILWLHQMLYWSTIGIIVLVALFIFRPVSNTILKQTYELTDARNSMAFVAVHDGLTGLYNRTFLTDHFDTLIKGAHRRQEQLAVVQFDLDRFKQINDTLGHAAGDYVLVATAQRMLASCRASDLCVRLGGDEFVMILNAAGNTEDIATVTKRILSRINEPIVFQSVTIMPGASAGIAVYPVDAVSSNDLLVHADLALYAAKKLGGGNASFFSDELRQELDHRKRMEADLREAIDQQAFEPYFQPQVSLTTGQITGIEALMRWEHPERGFVPPNDFLPLADKAGLMPPIGRIMMRKSIHRAAEWHHAGLSFGRIAVNASGSELRENDFDLFLFDTLKEAGLPPEKLSLEIVESVILDDEKTGITSKLRRIRAAGVHLELDDFGTGYASLSHINPNEIDRLKIDRRFVQNIDANNDHSKIVRAITELARALGISIIAEGAETEAELDLLQSIGCDEVQGYSIARPMPPAQAEEWLRLHTAKHPKLSVVGGKVA